MYCRLMACPVLMIALLIAPSRTSASSLLPIGIHIAADGNLTVGSTTGEQPELLGTSAVAGAVPISNWNDFVITRFKDGDDKSSTNLPTPQSISTSPTPFTLNDSSGSATTAQVTAWSGNDTFSVYGTSETSANPNAQLVNGLLGAVNDVAFGTVPAVATVSSVPFSAGYNVYVYFNNNVTNELGQVGLASGTYNSPTYYFATMGQESPSASPFFASDTASTTPGTFVMGNYVEIPVPALGDDGTTGQFTVTLSSEPTGTEVPHPTPSIAAIEIVPVGYVPEPSSLLLVGVAAIGLLLAFARKRAAGISSHGLQF